MGAKDLFITLTIIGMAVFLLIGFSIGFTNDNSTNVTLLNEPTINNTYAQLSNDLSGGYTNAKIQKGSFENDSLNTGTTGIISLTSIGGIWKSLWNYPQSMFNSVLNLIYVYIFGGDQVIGNIVLITIGTILIISLILAILTVIRTGFSE